MRQTLPKSNILRGYQSFSRVISQGTSFQSNRLLCYCLVQPSSRPEVWIGFSVLKKWVPQAVRRNRIKRLMREAVRKHFGEVKQWAVQKNYKAKIVLSYKRKQDGETKQIALHDIESEWLELQRQLLTSL
ncbi:MAG: ribonuclease P protein component [Bacteroidota bacterium]